jgi:hypothetical protein
MTLKHVKKYPFLRQPSRNESGEGPRASVETTDFFAKADEDSQYFQSWNNINLELNQLSLMLIEAENNITSLISFKNLCFYDMNLKIKDFDCLSDSLSLQIEKFTVAMESAHGCANAPGAAVSVAGGPLGGAPELLSPRLTE